MGEIRELITKLENITILRESKGHLDHPEDLVFLEGSSGAKRAIETIISTIEHPTSVTIKFDGYPSLIFGRGHDNKFSIMDKHMFNKKDSSGRKVYSPAEFLAYDKARGVDRGNLYTLISNIWPGLERDDRASAGYYWGDLLFSAALNADNNGTFTFKANPNGITYKVDSDSDIGRLLAGKTAGMSVHQFIPADAMSTDEAISLDGGIGNLQNASNVAIIPSRMPITPKLKMPASIRNIALRELNTYSSAITSLMDNAPQARNSFGQLFTVYINKKIVSGSLSNLLRDFYAYVEARQMSDGMKSKILAHLKQNKEGVLGAFKVWIAIYNLKMNVVNQLDNASKHSPVKGFLDDGTESHEGFVSNGIKYVNRPGFAAQNLGGKKLTEALKHDKSTNQYLAYSGAAASSPYAPGGHNEEEHEHLSKLHQIDNDKHAEAVYTYTKEPVGSIRTTPWYKRINSILRDGKPEELTGKAAKIHNNIMDMHKTNTPLENVHHVYSHLGEFDPRTVMSNKGVVDHKAHLSTSISLKDVVRVNYNRLTSTPGGHVLHIALPKGYTDGRYISNHSDSPGEHEMLLKPQKFKIHKSEAITNKDTGVTTTVHHAKPYGNLKEDTDVSIPSIFASIYHKSKKRPTGYSPEELKQINEKLPKT